MNEKQLHFFDRGVMDSINGTLEHYENDPTFAPADWILENWWNTPCRGDHFFFGSSSFLRAAKISFRDL